MRKRAEEIDRQRREFGQTVSVSGLGRIPYDHGYEEPTHKPVSRPSMTAETTTGRKGKGLQLGKRGGDSLLKKMVHK